MRMKRLYDGHDLMKNTIYDEKDLWWARFMMNRMLRDSDWAGRRSQSSSPVIVAVLAHWLHWWTHRWAHQWKVSNGVPLEPMEFFHLQIHRTSSPKFTRKTRKPKDSGVERTASSPRYETILFVWPSGSRLDCCSCAPVWTGSSSPDVASWVASDLPRRRHDWSSQRCLAPDCRRRSALRCTETDRTPACDRWFWHPGWRSTSCLRTVFKGC